jgi:hypothetical protein
LVYSLILPSSVFGVMHEEGGAGLVVRERSIVSMTPERAGWRRKISLFERADDGPLDLDYAQDLWDGCFRGGYVESCSQWIHHGCPD